MIHIDDDSNVKYLRLYLSARLPAISDDNANRIVNAVDASRPYCDLVNCKSMFMAVNAVAVAVAVEDATISLVVDEKSTR